MSSQFLRPSLGLRTVQKTTPERSNRQLTTDCVPAGLGGGTSPAGSAASALLFLFRIAARPDRIISSVCPIAPLLSLAAELSRVQRGDRRAFDTAPPATRPSTWPATTEPLN